MPKTNQIHQFQFQQDIEQPISFKEKWLPKIKYYLYVVGVFFVWLSIVGIAYWTFNQARRRIKLVEDVP